MRRSTQIDCIVFDNSFFWLNLKKKQIDVLVQVHTRYRFSEVVLNQEYAITEL